MPEELILERNGAIATIRLNRPDRRNALNRSLIQGLTQTFEQLAHEEAIRVVILTGNGTSFCSGMDLDELQQSLHSSEEVLLRDAENLSRLYRIIDEFPKATIAAINGPAIAGGAGLMSVCDLAVAVPSAKFGYPEVLRGLVAAMVMPYLLRLVDHRKARYLLLTGHLIDAKEALSCGLINWVVESDYLESESILWARALAQAAPEAIERTKRLLTRLRNDTFDLAELARESTEPRFSEECRQGLEAFFKKQSPPWIK